MEQKKILQDTQMGFGRKRGTMDAIMLLSKLIEEKKGRNTKSKIHAFFADFKGAFDKINREKLWMFMEEEVLSKELIEEIKMLFAETKCEIKVNGEIIGEFWTGKGLKQGCPLSGKLFIIYIRRVEKRMLELSGAGIRIGRLRHAC